MTAMNWVEVALVAAGLYGLKVKIPHAGWVLFVGLLGLLAGQR